MLYVTTRNDTDAFTHPRVLTENCASDGGFYAPFHLKVFAPEQILALKNKTFGQNVADILNLFFSAGIQASDVDFCIGRTPVRTASVNYKIVICESWHNADMDYQMIIRQLCNKLCPAADKPSLWTQVAVRIAVYFGIWGLLLAQDVISDDTLADVAVASDGYVDMTAVCYARKMGLPVGTLICGCKDDSLWNFLHRGELPTRNLGITDLFGMEHLIHQTLGCEMARRFVACCEDNQSFSVTEEQRQLLTSGMFAAVVSDKRTMAVISSVYRTNNYIIDSRSVLPYAALQDYRTKAGENRITLFCADRAPTFDADVICDATGITQAELSAIINRA